MGNSILRQACGLALSLLVSITTSSTAYTARPSIEAFGSLPAYSNLQLSPDGTRFAALIPIDGERRLAVYDMTEQGSWKSRVLTYKSNGEQPDVVKGFSWANNNRILLKFRRASERNEVPVVETRMLALDSDFSNQTIVPQPKLVKERVSGSHRQFAIYYPPQIQDRVVNTLPNDPDHVLLELTRYFNLTDAGRNAAHFAFLKPERNVYRLNINDATMTRIERGNRSVVHYMADAAGQVRLRTMNRDNNMSYEVRLPGSKKWESLLTWDGDLEASFHPLAFTKDPNILFISTRDDQGRRQIRDLDIRTKTVGEIVAAHPRVDMGELLFDEADTVIGVTHSAELGTRVTWFDEPYATLARVLDRAMPDTSNRIVSADSALKKFIVYSSSSTEPGFYSLLIPETLSLLTIARVYPGLKGQSLSPMRPQNFMARDGLKIPAFVTKPTGKGPFPLVVLPHGGPNSRDTLGFDYEVQFLASRGYAVLQPNFRGSTGYGRAFEEAGHGEWGMKMQDDITDGVKEMIAQGVADPDRICIMGWSYGGYASLMGAVKTPDLYKCAISGAPVTDLNKWMKERSKFQFATNNDPRIGDRWSDRGRMRDTSPANNVDAIKIPILLIHGDNDRTVSIEHSELMARKLKRAGADYKFIRIKGADHHHSLARHRIRYLKEVESFLKKHIGE